VENLEHCPSISKSNHVLLSFDFINYSTKLQGTSSNNNKGKYVRSITKTSTSINRVTKADVTLTATDIETADTINNYFVSVFTKDADIDSMPLFCDCEFRLLLSDIVITDDIVERAIKKVNPNKSPGPDNIHPKLVVNTCDTIKTPLTVVFNKSLQECKLPDDWKLAYVTPIFKKG